MVGGNTFSLFPTTHRERQRALAQRLAKVKDSDIGPGQRKLVLVALEALLARLFGGLLGRHKKT